MLVPFLGLDKKLIRGNHYYRIFSATEEIPLLKRWSDSNDPDIKIMLVGRISSRLTSEKDPELLSTFTKMKEQILNDPDPEIRIYGARRLIFDKENDLLPWIEKQEDPIRRDAALYFGTSMSPWLKDELKRVLKYGDIESKWEAHNRLLAMGESSESLEYLNNLSIRVKTQESYKDFRVLWSGVSEYGIDFGGGLENINKLTTPISYVPYIPNDPFKNSSYRFFRPEDRFSWLLQGAGPDGSDDIGPLLPKIESIITSNKRYDNKEFYQFMMLYYYDPTNGILSKGDYLFVW